MCRIAIFFLVTEAERKRVRRRARFQQHHDTSCHQVFFFLQGKAPKEIHAILTETLGEHAPSYVTVKNWVAQFKSGDHSLCWFCYCMFLVIFSVRETLHVKPSAW